MQNFKKRLYSNELQEIEQEMELAGYSNNFIFYVSNHFMLFFENAYVENTTALRQLKYYSAIGTLIIHQNQICWSSMKILIYFLKTIVNIKNMVIYFLKMWKNLKC